MPTETQVKEDRFPIVPGLFAVGDHSATVDRGNKIVTLTQGMFLKERTIKHRVIIDPAAQPNDVTVYVVADKVQLAKMAKHSRTPSSRDSRAPVLQDTRSGF